LRSSFCNVVTELSACKPKNPYECSKFEADNHIINSSKNSRVAYTIIRPTNIIGRRMKNNSFRQFIIAVSSTFYFKIGFKKNIANYIHINDVVSALISVKESKSAFNEIFILSNDMYLDDIVAVIRNKFNINYPIISMPKFIIIFLVMMLGSILNFPLSLNRVHSLTNLTSYSSKKISDILNFSPQVDKEFMILDMLN
jgi:nucleoside-diphosphate-sugar epimerase